MTISLSKAQYELLTKRNAAIAEAANTLRSAQLAVNLAQNTHKAVVDACNDVIVQITADANVVVGKLKSPPIFKANQDGTFELEFIEESPKENKNDPQPEPEPQLETAAE